MNLVGKIFTLLIFMLSMMALTFSVMVVGTHKNWRTIALGGGPNNEEGLVNQVNNANARIKAMQVQKDEVTKLLERERAARRAALGGLNTRLIALQAEWKQKQEQLAGLATKLGQDLEELETKQVSLTELTKNVQDTRKEIQEAQNARDDEYEKVVALTDQLNEAEGVRVRLEERRRQLQDQVARQRGVMGRLGVKFDPKRPDVMSVKNVNGDDETIPVAKIAHQVEGKVSQLSYKAIGTMVVSLGSHDGLQNGHHLEVFRNKTYLGRLVVVETSNDAAVVKIVPETRKGEIKVGDKVVTRFSPEYLKYLKQRQANQNASASNLRS